MTDTIALSRTDAEAFLYTEARLIDEDRLEEWLGLFIAEGIYWIPIDEYADPETETSIIYDDVPQLEKRIYQLRNRHLAQEPRSRTIHFITNIETEPGSSDSEVSIMCNTTIYEMRPGDHQRLQAGLGNLRTFPARCHYKLCQANGIWRILLKQVNLINRDLPLENITFIL